MKISNRTFAAAIAIGVFVALITTTAAHAQIAVTNNTACDIYLNLVDGSGNLSGPYLIPSGAIATVIPTPPGYSPIGIEDINGRTRKFTGSSECTGCVPLAAKGANDACCGNVCFDPGAQTITISSCSPCE